MKKTPVFRCALFILLFFSSLFSQAQAPQTTTVSGQLKGLSDGIVTLFYIQDGISKTDTLHAVQDSFTWQATLTEPIRMALTAGPDNYYFFAEPGSHIQLKGVKDSIQTYILSGSPMQQDADAFSAFTQDLKQPWDSLYTALKQAPAEEKAGIEKKRDELRKQNANRVAEFIAAHPKSSFSLYLIALERDYSVIKHLYQKLDESAQATTVGKRIAEQIAKLAKSQIGAPMIDFTQPDTNGNPVSFHRFKGQYVLVDFWASWCMPCRAENPNVLKAYQAYKDKGFTIIGISLDDKAANWKKAIRDDQLPWTQLSDLQGWKNAVALYFGIQAIPSNFLVDPAGKIIAKDLRGEMLENKLKELLP